MNKRFVVVVGRCLVKTKINNFLKKFYHSYVWLVFVLIIIDQLTKYFALKGAWDIEVIPSFFTLHYVRNTGAAWSLLNDNMPLLAVISFIAGAGMIYYRIYRRKVLNTYLKITFAVLLAGTWGNFIDRAFYEVLTGQPGVVDFLKFSFGALGDFPTFNVADICITLSLFSFIGYLIYDEIMLSRKEKEAKNEQKE